MNGSWTFPEIEPMTYGEAVELAIARTDAGEVVTRWSVTGDTTDPEVRLIDKEGVIREVRTRLVDAPQKAVFEAFSSLGGERGWRVWGWLWSIRGLLDQMVGGPGLRRGRREPQHLYPGEAVDFWRVEEYRPHQLLRLRAEMKVPGKAWLQFEAIPEGDRTRLVQTAVFAPTGFLGWLYWYGIYPLHAVIFSDMVDALARDATAFAAQSVPTESGQRATTGAGRAPGRVALTP